MPGNTNRPERMNLSRQPIFDANDDVWGRELVLRELPDSNEPASGSVRDNAAEHCDFFHGEECLVLAAGQEKAVRGLACAPPASKITLKISEDDFLKLETLQVAMKLKKEGYQIAVDDFTGRLEAKLCLGMIDLLCVDVRDRDDEWLRLIARKAGNFYPAKLAAKRVDTLEVRRRAAEAGFTLFQGPFLLEAEIIPDRRLTSHETSRINLLKAVEEEEPDFDDISRRIEADLSLSYRLLRRLNSPSFGFTREISSIKQATVLMGWKELRNWLRLIIVTDLDPEGGESELSFLAVQRGKFLEWAALNHDRKDFDSDNLFLLGLFSLLENMLHMPMDQISAQLPIDPEVKKALCRDSSIYDSWLKLLAAYETADWKYLDMICAEMGLKRYVLAITNFESIAWAKTFFRFQG